MYQDQLGVDDAIIYLLHRAHSHLERPGDAVRVMFFDFSSVFNTIQPLLLVKKLSAMRVDHDMAAWIGDYLSSRPQYAASERPDRCGDEHHRHSPRNSTFTFSLNHLHSNFTFTSGTSSSSGGSGPLTCGRPLKMLCQPVAASTLFFAGVCWGGGIKAGQSNRLNKLVRRASSGTTTGQSGGSGGEEDEGQIQVHLG